MIIDSSVNSILHIAGRISQVDLCVARWSDDDGNGSDGIVWRLGEKPWVLGEFRICLD